MPKNFIFVTSESRTIRTKRIEKLKKMTHVQNKIVNMSRIAVEFIVPGRFEKAHIIKIKIHKTTKKVRARDI